MTSVCLHEDGWVVTVSQHRGQPQEKLGCKRRLQMNPKPMIGDGLVSVSIPSQFWQRNVVSAIKLYLQNSQTPPGGVADVETPLIARDCPG